MRADDVEWDGNVRFERGVPVREWTELVCPPDVDWDHIDVRRALEVNKLSPDTLRGRPTFEALLPALAAELSHDVWVAHNAEFDVKMVNQELARLGRPAVAVTSKGAVVAWTDGQPPLRSRGALRGLAERRPSRGGRRADEWAHLGGHDAGGEASGRRRGAGGARAGGGRWVEGETKSGAGEHDQDVTLDYLPPR